MQQWFPCVALKLGSTPGSTCVFRKVTLHETIRIERLSSGQSRQESFEIMSDFTLRSRADDATLPDKIREINVQIQNHSSEPLTVEEADLEFLFAQEWPEWLVPILTAQLRFWRQHHVEHFYHYTPWEMTRDDVWRCVQATPTQAIRRFWSLLSRSQREICCKNAPQAAAAYAFESLDSFTRRRALEDYPEEILRNASLHLTDAELIALATRRPLSVFKCYRCMPARQRALALSAALKQRRGYPSERLYLIDDFVMESLVEFPQEWLAGSGGSFDAILASCAERLGWIPDGAEMMGIHQRLDPAYQADFRKAFALRV